VIRTSMWLVGSSGFCGIVLMLDFIRALDAMLRP
jgi:hypothetical protein